MWQSERREKYFFHHRITGLNVREKAKSLVNLLKDDERLKNERARALKAKQRFAQSASAFGSDGALDTPSSPTYPAVSTPPLAVGAPLITNTTLEGPGTTRTLPTHYSNRHTEYDNSSSIWSVDSVSVNILFVIIITVWKLLLLTGNSLPLFCCMYFVSVFRILTFFFY